MKSLRNWNMYCSCKFLNIQGQRDFYYLHIIIRLLFLFNSRSETREREKKTWQTGQATVSFQADDLETADVQNW